MTETPAARLRHRNGVAGGDSPGRVTRHLRGDCRLTLHGSQRTLAPRGSTPALPCGPGDPATLRSTAPTSTQEGTPIGHPTRCVKGPLKKKNQLRKRKPGLYCSSYSV